MVHRLPAGTTPEQLVRVMQKKTKVIAQEAEGIEFTGTTGKTHVILWIFLFLCSVGIVFRGNRVPC